MRRRFLVRAVVLALLAVTVAAETRGSSAQPPPPLESESGSEALATLDLAGVWSFDPNDLPPTTIQVPGGGWFKQGFVATTQAVYSRRIEIPDVDDGQVTTVELGAVNHEATLFIDGRRVGTQTTSFTPQSFDISGFVVPGGSHDLRVEVKGRGALTSEFGWRYTVPTAAEWCESIPQGIFGSARLRVYPAVHISDAFVRTSVADDSLTVDAWVTNASTAPQQLTLSGSLASANGSAWVYPNLPSETLTVAAGATQRVRIGPVSWGLGRDSYWWPNVPYRPGYRAELHDLTLQLYAHGAEHRARYRVGFRESSQVRTATETHYELNGVRVNLRGDSLQGAMYDRIDNGGRGDAYHTLPGFLPPSNSNPGWPKAVDNYLRLNFNVVRIHQEPASPYMLDVADERGLMIIDETAIRGSENRQDYTVGRANMVEHVRDLVLRDRNHPSIIRWSQANEADLNSTEPAGFMEQLYEAIMALDDTRPISVDVSSDPYDHLTYDNFSAFQHYFNEDGLIAVTGYTDDVHPRPDRPYGRGEFIWPAGSTYMGFTWFATATEKMREKNGSDIRPYSLAHAWASVIPGVGSKDFLTDGYVTFPLYGEDNLPDPWSNRQIMRTQRAFNPVAVVDRDFWETHKRSDAAGNWPTAAPTTIRAGSEVTRALVVFNDTFDSRDVDVAWQVRADAPDGPVVASGSFREEVAEGERATHDITFTASRSPGLLYLVLTSSRTGQGLLFSDADQYFTVI